MVLRQFQNSNKDSMLDISSAKLFHYKRLDYYDKIRDGFTYCKGYKNFPPTKCLRQDDCEIVKIDFQQDTELKDFLYQAVEKILGDMSTLQKAQILAWFTVDRLGGEAVEEELAEAYQKQFNGQEGHELLVGNLSVGLSIHRAILFKFLCDSQGIQVKIIQAESATEVYLLEHDTEYAVNLMDQPGFIRLSLQVQVDQEEVGSISRLNNRRSPRRLIPLGSLRKKFARSRSKNIPQPQQFNDSVNDPQKNLDIDLDCVLIYTQKSPNPTKNFYENNQGQIDESGNSVTSSSSGIGIQGLQFKILNKQNTNYDTSSNDDKSSITDTSQRIIETDTPSVEDFKFDVPPQLQNEKTAILNENNTSVKIQQGLDSNPAKQEKQQEKNDSPFAVASEINLVKNLFTTPNNSNNNNNISTSTQTTSAEDNFVETLSQTSIGSRQIGKAGNWDSWIIRVDELTYIRTLGAGSFGEVCLGRRGDKLVAYKKIFPPKNDDYYYGPDEIFQKKAEEKQKEDFMLECQILMHTADENIVQFYGVDPDNKCIVTEYVRHGSVYNLLHRKGNKYLQNFIRDNLGVRLEMALQVAKGLQYLHDKNIWHLDLKSQNLLVGESYNHILVKLCDFGISRIEDLRAPNSCSTAGTREYMAPELLRDPRNKSAKADIFSFAILLYELVTLIEPWGYLRLEFGQMAQHKVYALVAIYKKRLQIPENVPERIKNLIEKCWAEEPSERPSPDEIIVEIKKLLKIYPTKSVFECQKQSQQTTPC